MLFVFSLTISETFKVWLFESKFMAGWSVVKLLVDREQVGRKTSGLILDVLLMILREHSMLSSLVEEFSDRFEIGGCIASFCPSSAIQACLGVDLGEQHIL